MKKALLFCCLCLGQMSLSAQIFEVDTIQYSGAEDKRINIVFLGDGYQSQELNQYRQDVNSTVEEIFVTSPFQEYRDYFNVFAILVPSVESGASHPGNAFDEPSGSNHPVSSVNNYFGSTFDFAGIHRLVVATNNFAINNVLANNFPNYDQVFILVNSGFYGGSGGVNAVSTTHPSAGEIAIHEIGHSFANLADEYYAGDQFAGEWPNMTMETDPNQVKWRNWHGDQGIGIYQHCCSGNATSWYKPHQNCKMQFLGVPFCAVCKETFVETIHDLVSPIDSYTPTDLQLDNTGQDIEFQTNLIYPIPNTLAIRWILNGDPLANTGDALTLTADQLDNGINQLTFEVVDQTTLSRSDAHPGGRLFFVNWQIEKTATSIEALGEQRSVEFSVFPNPFVEQVLIDYRLDETAMVGYQLYDLRGQVLRQQTPQRQAAGAHQVQLDLSQYPAGNYLLRWIIDTFTIDRTLVKPIGN